MQLNKRKVDNIARHARARHPGVRRHTGSSFRIQILCCLAAGIALAAITAPAQQQAPNPCKPIILPEANRPPDANDQMAMRDQKSKKDSYAAANTERRKQIADDSAKLVKLATDLKAEVDKTSKDTLSLNVIRKADEIERLAHNVKEKMKLTVGPG